MSTQTYSITATAIQCLAGMKIPVVLLLTNDPQLEEAVAETLVENGGVSHLANDPGDALQLVCGLGRHLDLAIIDFDHGPHGMTLLGAINMCREDFPVVVVTRDDEKHVEALAYANGAAACLPKPVSVAQLTDAMRQCCRPQYQLALTIPGQRQLKLDFDPA
jgi:DNA-binding response OmpR family regulator